jgi:hypothetical protein
MATANTKDLGKLSDDALIKAHVREAQGAYPNGISRTEAGRAMLAADPDRRAIDRVFSVELRLAVLGGIDGTEWGVPQVCCGIMVLRRKCVARVSNQQPASSGVLSRRRLAGLLQR